jgi:hypothetical protein
MNGTEVAKAARLLRPGLKVLFFSGYSEQALGELGQLDPGSALLQKPYRRQDVTQAIRRLLSS